MVAAFPPAVVSLLTETLGEHEQTSHLTSFVQQLLRHTLDITSFADRWLFGSPRIHDEQSLLFTIEAEAQMLGLGDRHPIVVPGDADNFRTLVADPYDVVFGPLRRIGWTGDLHNPQLFAFLQVPEYEGRNGPWRPIILGHELAHLAVLEHDVIERLDLARRLELESIPIAAQDAPEAYIRYLEIAEGWATELLCDAHAVRRFGPAALASLGEFLTAAGALSAISATHPPAALRLHVMIEWLGQLPTSFDPIVNTGRKLTPFHRLKTDPLGGLAVVVGHGTPLLVRGRAGTARGSGWTVWSRVDGNGGAGVRGPRGPAGDVTWGCHRGSARASGGLCRRWGRDVRQPVCAPGWGGGDVVDLGRDVEHPGQEADDRECEEAHGAVSSLGMRPRSRSLSR